MAHQFCPWAHYNPITIFAFSCETGFLGWPSGLWSLNELWQLSRATWPLLSGLHHPAETIQLKPVTEPPALGFDLQRKALWTSWWLNPVFSSGFTILSPEPPLGFLVTLNDNVCKLAGLLFLKFYFFLFFHSGSSSTKSDISSVERAICWGLSHVFPAERERASLSFRCF